MFGMKIRKYRVYSSNRNLNYVKNKYVNIYVYIHIYCMIYCDYKIKGHM